MTAIASPELSSAAGYDPNGASGHVTREMYNRSPEELDEIESLLIESIRAYSDPNTGLVHESGVVAVAVPGNHPYASFGRTLETDTFVRKKGEHYDFYVGMEPYEPYSTFLYTVDLDLGKIAHSKRLVGAKTAEERAVTGLTGIEPIDDRVTANDPREGADVATILAWHNIKDIERTFNVATNETTGRAEQTMAKPYTLMSYKAVFLLAAAQGATDLFAYVNPDATKSLTRFGVHLDLLAGRELHLPLSPSSGEESGAVQYDPNYVAVCIPESKENVAAFTQVNPKFPLTRLIADKDVPLLFLQPPLEAAA